MFLFKQWLKYQWRFCVFTFCLFVLFVCLCFIYAALNLSDACIIQGSGWARFISEHWASLSSYLSPIQNLPLTLQQLWTLDLHDRESEFSIQLQLILRLKSIKQKIHMMWVPFSKTHFTICLILFTFFQVISFCVCVEL